MLDARTVRAAALFLLALSSMAASSAETEITIGVASAQTGTLASYDQPALAGFRMAIKEINANGGLGKKYKAKLIVKDTRSDMATSATVALELIDAGASIIITPCDADPSIVIGQMTQPLDIPTLTFCGSSPILPGAVGDMMFSTYPTDNLQAAALADYAHEQDFRSVYLLTSPDSTYTAGLPEYFGRAFERMGGKIVGHGRFSMGQADFSAIVTAIRHLGQLGEAPDLIMTAAYEPDFPAFIRQLRSAGVVTPVFGADAIGTPTVQGLGDLVDAVVFTTIGCADPGSRLEAFNRRFEELTGRAPQSTYEVSGYEIGLILDAALGQVGEAGGTSGRAIRDAIANLKDLQIVTSKITYAGTDRIPVRSVTLQRYRNGMPQCLASVTPSRAEIPAP